jgi:hypothetical protein
LAYCCHNSHFLAETDCRNPFQDSPPCMTVIDPLEQKLAKMHLCALVYAEMDQCMLKSFESLRISFLQLLSCSTAQDTRKKQASF